MISVLSALMFAGCAKTGASQTLTPPAAVHTYRMRVADHLTQPARLDELLDQYFDVHLLLRASYTPGQQLRVDVASVNPDNVTQNTCAVTQTLDGISLDGDNNFTTRGDVLRFVTDGTPVELVNYTINAAVSDEGFTATRISGFIDTAPLVGLMGADDPGAICQLVGKILPCQPCPHNDNETCWDVALESVNAPTVSEPVAVRTADIVDTECAEEP